MRCNKFKLTVCCCGMLSAVIGWQSVGATPAEDSSKPNVKETSKQLEEVIKLLKQGENSNTEATDNNAQDKSDKKTETTTKGKTKP